MSIRVWMGTGTLPWQHAESRHDSTQLTTQWNECKGVTSLQLVLPWQNCSKKWGDQKQPVAYCVPYINQPRETIFGITQQPFYEHESVKDSCFSFFLNIDSPIWMTKEFSIDVWKQWIFRQQCTRHRDVKAGKREGDNLSGPPRNK